MLSYYHSFFTSRVNDVMALTNSPVVCGASINTSKSTQKAIAIIITPAIICNTFLCNNANLELSDEN